MYCLSMLCWPPLYRYSVSMCIVVYRAYMLTVKHWCDRPGRVSANFSIGVGHFEWVSFLTHLKKVTFKSEFSVSCWIANCCKSERVFRVLSTWYEVSFSALPLVNTRWHSWIVRFTLQPLLHNFPWCWFPESTLPSFHHSSLLISFLPPASNVLNHGRHECNMNTAAGQTNSSYTSCQGKRSRGWAFHDPFKCKMNTKIQ